MTEREEAPFSYHFLWYILQLIFSAPGVMIASIPFLGVLKMLGLNEGGQPGKFAGYEALGCLCTGVLVGWWMAHRAPLLARSGRWIWVVPVVIILADILRLELHPRAVPGLSSYLFASGEFGLGVGFFTLPACSVAGYSAGMAVWVFNRKWATGGSSSARERLITMASVSIIVFCILAVALQDYETRSMARRSKIRSVIEKPGLQLWPDAQSLCGGPTSAKTLRTLSLGTHAQSIERVGCDGNRLIEPDNLPPPVVGRAGPFLLEHVRVLDGPSAGVEGWVPQYGLMELFN